MTTAYWRNLVIVSIKDPATAARTLMELHLPSQALWMALALVAVLNTALFTLSNLLMPGPSPLPAVFSSPLLYIAIVTVGLILTIYALYWIGRLFKGKGSLADVMVLIVWMQVLRVLAQAAALVLVMTVPVLAVVLVFAAALVGVYMLVHFVDQAHRFGSVGRSAMVLIASLLAIAFGLSLIITLFGGPNVGSLPNV